MMVNSSCFIGCLMLVASLSPVYGLCSTCLEEKCYDNGECIIGCVPGYVGEYCNEECPPRCLNKVCHLDIIDGSVTCTDGCEPGCCGATCKEHCAGGCVTCDRQCGSCNVTVCPERRYGADCRRVCSERYGKCDKETGQCIICRRGYYGDECNQDCETCFTRAETIYDECLSGCDICKSKGICPAGFRGDACELPCSPGCENRENGCNRATGECSEGCVSGYHGLTCNYKCSERCVSGRCNRATGECSEGCVSGYHGLTCNYKCSERCVSGRCNRATGECSDGCVSGYHGLTCNYSCSAHCLSGRCNKATGECSYGCVSGYHGLTCNYTCNTFCEGGVCNQHDGVCTSGCISGYKSNLDICEKYENEGLDRTVSIAVPIIILVCLVAGIATAVFIWRRRRSRRYSRHDEESLELVKPLMRADLDEKAKKQIKNLTKETKTKIESLTSGMIRVSAVDTVINMLQSGRNWVTITGNAGDGKTTLGYLILKELQNKPQRQKNIGGKINVYSIDEPEECTLLLKLNENSVIMLDDRFGAFTSDQVLIDKWKNVMSSIHQHFTSPRNQIKVIFISRKNVVNEARDYLGHFRDSVLDPDIVVDLSLLKIKDERLKILDYYLKQDKLKVSRECKQRVADLDIAHGFPHCSMMYPKLKAKKSDLDIEEFFKTPLKFLEITTAVLYRENCKDLFKLMIENNGQFDVYSVKDDAQRESLMKVEREQEGSYITVWKNGVCVFAHPSIYESVLSVICDTDPLFCVKYATLSVIRQKLTLTSDERQKSPTRINVEPVPAVLKALAERFRQEILQGDYTVFGLKFCDNEDFCKELVASCVYSGTADPEQNCSKRFINQAGRRGRGISNEDTMLWTAFRSGNIVAVCVLMREGASIQDVHDWDRRTPLHYLCQEKNSSANADQHFVDIDSIRMIIKDGGGNVNVCDKYGRTPLHYLLKHQTILAEAIKFMIRDMESDPNLCEQHKSTPLHYLCANSSLQMDTVDLVIKEGKGDFNKGDEHGTTPFHFLCNNGKTKLDVVRRIVNTAKGDINKQDDNGITPLHVLCKGSLPMENILTLINQGDKADMYGNTPLHFLCRRRGINAEELLQQLTQIPETDRMTQNVNGYTPLDYLTDQDDRLPWTDGMIARSAADLVLCRLKHGEDWIYVLGRAMILNSERVHKLLQVEDFGRVLTNLERSGDRKSPGQFSGFRGTCSSPVPVPPSPSPLTTPPSYWETSSTLTRRKRSRLLRGLLLLEMGLTHGRSNMDEGLCVSALPNSVCVSVTDNCHHHPDRLCIRVWRRDEEDSERHQVGECVSLSLPTRDVELTLTFGLVLDVGRGRVGFIDVERGQLLCKVDLQMKEEVSPMFYVYPRNNNCATRMRLISGREICVTDRKIHLIQQALSD